MSIRPWLLAARPKTLSAAVVPVLVGSRLAGRVDWFLFVCTLLGAVLIQIGTNLVNDALDFRKGTDNSERLGPLRVTQAGLLSDVAVMRGAYACFFAAMVCGVPLVIRGGWPLLAIGLASIAAAYAYTGGPYPLAYHGLGELFVVMFFGVIAVGGTFYVQRLAIDSRAIVAGVAVGLLAVVLLAINNLRDIHNDRASNKRTMAARFGERFARIEVAVCALLPFALVFRMAWTTAIALPLALAVVIRVWRSDGAALNPCLAMAGALQWAFGLLFLIR